MPSTTGFSLLAVELLLCAAPGSSAEPTGDAYRWVLPKGFPKPRVPADNPMSAVKVELGRYLFYDQRMSVNGTASCATCHRMSVSACCSK